jgi:hypothetical protein
MIVLGRENIPLLSKLFIWSILLEPLLYFTIGGRYSFGVTLSFSRILQMLVVLIWLLDIIIKRVDFNLPNPFHRNNIYYTYFVLYSLVALLFGIYYGAFILETKSLYSESEYNSNNTGYFSFLTSPSFRPFFEYFIYLYYFIYFAAFQRYFIKNKATLDYFFKIFIITFSFSLFIGSLDFLLSFYNIDLVTRFLYDSTFIPNRFHSLAGEPRDAFIYLIFGALVLSLRNFWIGNKSLPYKLLSIIIICIVLTQSASGVVGALIAGGLVSFYLFFKALSLKRIINFFFYILLLALVLFALYENSTRLQSYGEALTMLYDTLSKEDELPLILNGQMNDIFPMWTRFKEIVSLNFYPLLIGTGFGSASVVTNNLAIGSIIESGEILNPHSQIVRLIYESGIIGFGIFILAFLKPIERLSFNQENTERLIIMILIMIGCFMGHRSSTLFIFFGLMVSVLNFKNLERESKI